MKQKTLIELRTARGLTRQEVANLINKSLVFVYMLETGRRNASDNTKRDLAKLYNCSIEDIFLALKLTQS